jgi:membrane fusion protein (multidrug efflux system)
MTMTDEAERSDDSAKADAAQEDEKKGPALSPRTKIIMVVAGLLVLVVAAIWFVRHKTYGQYFQSTNDATIQADAVAISPRVSGYVEQVLVTDNQDVQQGQPLARIDVRDYEAKSAQAQAQVAEADASADNARASIAEQYASIRQAAAQLSSARIKAAHDAREAARYGPLAASGAETREKLADLRTAAEQSAQQVREQAAALEMQKRRVAGMQAQVRQAQAQGAGAKAQLASAAVDVNAAQLKAPFAGRIGDKTVQVGQYVQAGTRLMSVVPLSQLYITANFKETQLALMRPGQPAKISVDALGGLKVDGRVESVSPGTGAQFSILPPQNATGNFTKIVQRVPVRIAVRATPAARRLLVPGLSVTVVVDTRAAKDDLDHIRDEQKRAEKQN